MEREMASKFFTRNEHNVERVLRVLLGIGLISLVFVGPQTMWGWLGLIPLATGLSGVCPLYSVLGINTCPKETGA
jgi:hypothetical protein